jgi:phosphoribosylamine--glycine ligase
MDILIVGSGGREHALAWKLKQSPKVKTIFVAPGNAGTSQLAKNLDLKSIEEIVEWLKANLVGLVVIGPDNYLAEGLVDRLDELKIPVFGPTKKAAEIEWSKAFAKELMKTEGIPTARYEIFDDLNKAQEYLLQQTFPVVIKANGLALGKGVIIANDLTTAKQAVTEIMGAKIFGEAGRQIIIEEYLSGQEISVHAFCDGKTALLFPAAKDHKRIFENDQGPNTGGMGTIAPVPGVTSGQMAEIREKVVIPTIRALSKRGRLFRGVLFPGIMLTDQGPKVIEFNARFGDPETQVYLPLLETDLLDILLACLNGTLDQQEIQWSNQSAACIVCASAGYPGPHQTGKIISGLNHLKNNDVIVFQAGTKLVGDETVTNGGRVLGVTATGKDLNEALANAYQNVNQISFEGMQYRPDIGRKAICPTDS